MSSAAASFSTLPADAAFAIIGADSAAPVPTSTAPTTATDFCTFLRLTTISPVGPAARQPGT
ncbi:hypothetical protein KRM28CT15_37320 [Krasilnikovia sp. M28-CT-15]